MIGRSIDLHCPINNYFKKCSIMRNEKQTLKIIVVSDTHLGFDYPIKPRIKRRRRGEDFFRNFNIALDYALEVKADLVLHCGDFFFRSKIPAPIIDIAYCNIFDFAEKGIPILIIPGNHERSLLPQSILTQHPNIHIFHKPSVYTITMNNFTVAISGFPFIRKESQKEFDRLLPALYEESKYADVKLIAMHQVIEGASVGPVNFTFTKGDDIISQHSIPQWCNGVLCGHIHRHQVLTKQFGSDRMPIIFPGSVERTSFAEKNETKGFIELEIGMDKSIKYNFIKLKTRPMIDLIIKPKFFDSRSLGFWLRKKTTEFPEDSILKISSNSTSNYDFLKAEFLRQVIPSRMNWEVKIP